MTMCTLSLLFYVVCNLSELCVHGSAVESNCTCNCTDTGYTGARCEQDVDECEVSSPCGNGTCNNTDGGFLCQCDPGYTGHICDANISELTGNQKMVLLALTKLHLSPAYVQMTMNFVKKKSCEDEVTCTDRIAVSKTI